MTSSMRKRIGTTTTRKVNVMPVPELLYYETAPSVCAFSTCRRGGFSVGTYAGFNANAFCGDDERSVSLNRDLLCRHLSIDPLRLVIPHQTHGCRVFKVDEAFFRADADGQAALLEGVDAVMTDLPQTLVCVSTADCIPVLLYDEAHHAVAAVHAGWRGTVQRIVERGVAAMQNEYGTNAADLQAIIGPGISIEAFEVGDEVYQAFFSAGFPMEALARRYPANVSSGEKWHIDLWAANRRQLEHSGVPSGQIRTAGICTYSNSDRFFSARRLGIRSGRILNGIFLK